LAPGTYNQHYDLPFDPRIYYSRFRLTWGTEGHFGAMGDITPWGEFIDEVQGVSVGEVEDYIVPEPAGFALAAIGLLAAAVPWLRSRKRLS
jgi:hypothetical protein